MDVVLTTSRGYDVMLWGDCGGSGYNASSKYKYWSWSYENKIPITTYRVGYSIGVLVKGYVFKGRF